jgi:transposase
LRHSQRGGRRRLGAISKQGNTMVRWLLIEAVYPAERKDLALRQDYHGL